MDEFDICTLSESENKILDYDVFDNYYKIRSKYGYNEELNNNIKKEMEAMLNGILITEEEYKQEKSKKEELQLYLNILQEGTLLYFNKLKEDHNKEKEDHNKEKEDHNKEKEEALLYFNKLQEDHNKEKEESTLKYSKEKEEATLKYIKEKEEATLKYSKEKEEATLKYSKLVEEYNNLKEDYNKIDEIVLNFDKNFDYKNIKRKLCN